MVPDVGFDVGVSCGAAAGCGCCTGRAGWASPDRARMVEPLPQPAAHNGGNLLGGGSGDFHPGRGYAGVSGCVDGLAIGAGGALGFLLGYRKQYARIAAGEFIRANMSRRLRIARDLSWPVALILLAVCMAYFVRSGMFGQILGFMLALSVIGWISYAVTILWERRHRTTLIAERGSMYTLDMATGGERV